MFYLGFAQIKIVLDFHNLQNLVLEKINSYSQFYRFWKNFLVNFWIPPFYFTTISFQLLIMGQQILNNKLDLTAVRTKQKKSWVKDSLWLKKWSLLFWKGMVKFKKASKTHFRLVFQRNNVLTQKNVG